MSVVIEETFVKVPGWEKYIVSNYGRVMNEETGYEFACSPNRHGYPQVLFSYGPKKRTFAVHHLVAMLFLEDYEPGKQVIHKNKNKLDNGVLNLKQTERGVPVVRVYPGPVRS